MLNNFLNEAQLKIIQTRLQSVSLDDARVADIEYKIYSALSTPTSDWNVTPIAPLAEPANLNELTEAHYDLFLNQLSLSASRIDAIYTSLNSSNNLLKNEMESVERSVIEALDSVNYISAIKGQDPQTYYWVSDSFNNTTFVDTTISTALVNTDHGLVLLNPTAIENIRNYQPVLNFSETKGLPGCNMLVLDQSTGGNPDKEPNPVLETANTADFGSLFDNDATSSFEIERNFVIPKQKVIRQGRAYVKSSAGNEVDVKEATKDLDWRVYVQWFNKDLPETGLDGKGVELAEFIDLDNTQRADLNATLVFDIVMANPKPLSFLSLNPIVRNDKPVHIQSIKAYSDDDVIIIAKDVELNPTQRTTTLLNQEIIRRTGATTVGGLFTIPTNKAITRIEVRLTGAPERANYGLAHQFKEKLEHTRREQRVIFFSIVKHEEVWSRIAANSSPRQLTATYSGPKLLGSIPTDLQSAYSDAQQFYNQLRMQQNQMNGALGSLSNALQQLTLTQQAQEAQKAGQTLGNLGGGLLGGLGSVLGTFGGIVGGIASIGNIANALFGFNKTVEVIDERTGYDIFDGYRAGVGLRDINVQLVVYATQSVLQTVKRVFPGPIKQVGLFVEESIPAEWGGGDWITYEVSVDGGTWLPINKQSNAALSQGVEFDTPTDSLYLRAILNGQASDSSTSPALKHYTLQGVPA